MKYKHIIFDIDGTLLDSFATGIGSLQKTLKEELGVDYSMESLKHYFGIPSFMTVKDFPFKDERAAFERWEANYRSMAHLIVPFEGVNEMLAKLHKAGYKLGVLTSRCQREFDGEPRMAAWLSVFNCIVTSADTDKHKPDPAPMFAYMKKAGALPSECLYIGDGIVDSQCAERAGVDFVLADWRNFNYPIPALAVMRSADDLFEFLDAAK